MHANARAPAAAAAQWNPYYSTDLPPFNMQLSSGPAHACMTFSLICVRQTHGHMAALVKVFFFGGGGVLFKTKI